ncbi:MAG: hypothetical protein LJE95_09080 [Acidobacteria bacterium]|jgi:uncharacterized membrane protein|nr:hypothetical protein [Acidobacteriota bacterium]
MLIRIVGSLMLAGVLYIVLPAYLDVALALRERALVAVVAGVICFLFSGPVYRLFGRPRSWPPTGG